MERLPMDHDLHMVKELKPRETNLGYLKMLRLQAEQGYFGYKPYSMPRGDNLFRLTSQEIANYAEADKRASIIGKH